MGDQELKSLHAVSFGESEVIRLPRLECSAVQTPPDSQELMAVSEQGTAES